MPRREWAFLLVLFLVLPSVFADVTMNISDTFATVGRWLSEIFQNEYATFGVTLILFTILLRAIYAAGLKKVKVFEGAGGEGLNTFGNTITWTMSIMSSIAIYYLKADRDITTFLRQVLGPAAVYAGIASVVLMFWWIKASVGTKWAIPLTGLASIMISNIVQWPMLATLGVLMMIIGFFWVAAGLAKPRSSASSYRDVRNEESDGNRMRQGYDANRGLDNTIANEENQERLLQQRITDLEAREAGYDAMINQYITSLSSPGAAQSLGQLLQREKNEIINSLEQRKFLYGLNEGIRKNMKEEEAGTGKKIHKFKEDMDQLKKDNSKIWHRQKTKVNELLHVIGTAEDTLRTMEQETKDIDTIEKELIETDKKRIKIVNEQLETVLNAAGKQISDIQNKLLGLQEQKKNLDKKAHSDQKELNVIDQERKDETESHKNLIAGIPKKISDLESLLKSEEVAAAAGEA